MPRTWVGRTFAEALAVMVCFLGSGRADPGIPSARRLPLAFIENQGQTDPRAKFYVRARGETVWLTEGGLVFDLQRVKPGSEKAGGDSMARRLQEPWVHEEGERERLVFAQDFVGARMDVAISGLNQQPGTYNYFLGNDPKKWRTGVRASSVVVYKDLYDGIDFKVYGNGRDLEQEFIVRPGGDPSVIRISYRGIDCLGIGEDGSLLIKTAFGALRETRPRIYQEVPGKDRLAVTGRFRLENGNTYRFEIDEYDGQLPLVIDPTLLFSTYLGGRGDENVYRISVDGAGNSYCVGTTSSPDFPATIGVFHGGQNDVFLTKLNAAGTALVYSAYIGGANIDVGYDVAINGAGNAHVVTYTRSTDFPTTPGAYDISANGEPDAFIIKLDPTGESLVYGTYLGGSQYDEPTALGMDSDGALYVCGLTASGNFPTTPDVVQPAHNNPGVYDSFVTKLNPAGSALLYSTFLGGTSEDLAYAMAIDSSGNVYLGGYTSSGNFPTTIGALQRTLRGVHDAFVTKLNATGSAFEYSTYLGGIGSNEFIAGVRIDPSGSCYVAGRTDSIDFPTTRGAIQSSPRGGPYDAFVAKVNSRGSGLAFSTYLGGNEDDRIHDVAVDTFGNVYVVGYTKSTNFPVSPDSIQVSNGGNYDAFVAKIDAKGTTLSFSTYLGGAGEDSAIGIHVDDCGDAHFGGLSPSSGFPTTAGSYQEALGGGTYDAFVAHLPLGSELRASTIAVYPSQDVEIPIVATSGLPVSAIQITLESPLTFLPPADPRDLVRGTVVEAAEKVQATSFGNGTFFSIGIFADFDPPFEGKTFDLCPGGIIARPRFRLGNYSQRTDLLITVHAQAGNPPRYSLFTTAEGRDLEPILTSGVLKVVGFFTRGDANSDFRVTISDIVFILRVLFAGDSSTPRCSDAADANDDNVLNVADATFLVSYIFGQGAVPPPPGGTGCGLDPTPSQLPKDCLEACP